ncbi:MAG: sigma-54 dependent transcriptional regulator [Opitutales bacterium]
MSAEPAVEPVLIALFDPERAFAEAFRQPLQACGWEVAVFRSEAVLEKRLAQKPANVVIKTRATSSARQRLMTRLQALCTDMEFIFVTSSHDVRTAMEAIHSGAFDCLPLPCPPDLLTEAIRRALAHQLLAAEDAVLLARLRHLHAPDAMAGESKSMRQVQQRVARVADTDVTVLLMGESGTGKELVARRLHELSARRAAPFIAVNCAALPDSLLESELFGHVRGAFTGAVADKPGRFELARGGTLFLDEIGDLSPLGQADLLRVLEDGIFRPIGSAQTVRADVRIVAATNVNLANACREGRFREDLFYRLNVITLLLPPLRERPEDIPPLAERFLLHFCRRHRRPTKQLSPALIRHLQGLPWPGNVRELRNTIERMVLLSPERRLEPAHLPEHLEACDARSAANCSAPLPPQLTLADLEAEWIRRTLARLGGNRTETALQLGISRRALHYKLQRMGSKEG